MTVPLQEALLEAHVAFVVKEISAARLQPYLESRLDTLLGFAERLRLNDVVTAQMIKETAKRYACEVELSVAIPEMAAEVGRVAHAHPVHRTTRLGDLFPDRHLQELVDKCLEMRQIRDSVVKEIVKNPVYADLMADILLQTLKKHFGQQVGIKDLPGGRQLLKFGVNLMGATTPQLSVLIEDAAREFVANTIGSLMQEAEGLMIDSMESGILRDAVLDIWQELRGRTTGSFRDMISALDVEEIFVILYDYWRDLRRTDFYAAFIDSGIDAFFEHYGDTTLAEILREVGITRELMIDDAMRFAPHVLKVLKRKKMLEIMVRNELAPFYHSGQIEKVLAAHQPQTGVAQDSAK